MGPNARLSSIFGPYIPILFPFLDAYLQLTPTKTGWMTPDIVLNGLGKLLRPDVPYIIVSQNDEGPVPGFPLSLLPNVLVLSAGGYGHVPLPLLKQPEELRNFKDVQQRSFEYSFVGSARHSPGGMREIMEATLQEKAAQHKERVFIGRSPRWKEIMGDSRVSFAPRGFGRTSFHMAEAWQMGLLPVHVFTDQAWIPYADLYDQVGFKTKLEELPQMLEKLMAISAKELREMEAKVVEMRQTHFTTEGVLSRILQFMVGDVSNSDLRCQRLPRTLRDANYIFNESVSWCHEHGFNESLCARRIVAHTQGLVDEPSAAAVAIAANSTAGKAARHVWLFFMLTMVTAMVLALLFMGRAWKTVSNAWRAAPLVGIACSVATTESRWGSACFIDTQPSELEPFQS